MNKKLQPSDKNLSEAQTLRQHLGGFFDNAIDSIIVHDLGGRIMYSNGIAAKLHGYEQEEYMKMNLLQLLTPESAAQFEEHLRNLMKSGHSIFEVTHLHKNGTIIPLEIHVQIIELKGKKVILSIERNISDRKNMENELKLRAQLLDAATDSIILYDLDGTILYANTAAAKIRGYTMEQLMTMNIKQFVLPSHLPGFYDRRKKIIDDGQYIYETTLLHGNGSQIPIEINSRIIEVSNKKVILSIARDIRERKRIETDLKLKAEIIDLVNDSVFLLDFNGKIQFVNAEACKMLGYTYDELTSMNMSQVDIPEHAAGAPFRRKMADEQGYFNFESIHIRKNGSTIPVEANIRIINVDGKKQALGVVRDISERKKAEEKRLELEQKAHNASRLATVGEMAAGIAHEINNPLTGVIGYAQLLMKRGDLPEDVQKDLNTIYDSSQRVASIVKRMLAFARQTKPVRNYININDLIKNTLDLRTYHLEASNIEVHTELDSNLPVTIADSGQLQQVFINLIINAEHALKQTHKKGHLAVKTEQVNGNIKITIADDGPGIPLENLKRIFDPFFTTKEVGQGTGLGLSICHGIITEHDGSIYAESKPGQGATFTIELPITTAAILLEPEVPPAEVEKTVTKAKILVVDDEAVVRDLLGRLLTEDGHEVETVDSASNALEIIKENRYSLILLDIKMPGISGIELYHKIRSIARSLTDRIIFVTGDVMGQETMDFLVKNNARYITKPVDSIVLRKKINEVLSGQG